MTTALSGITLTATATPSSATYQWFDCATGNPISGATSMTYVATANGNYAVVVATPNGCTDTSACTNINSVGIEVLNSSSSITVYPNPATTTIHAVWSGGNISAYSVYDVNGRVVVSKSFDVEMKEVKFSVESFENGTYILQWETIAGTITKQFVKN